MIETQCTYETFIGLCRSRSTCLIEEYKDHMRPFIPPDMESFCCISQMLSMTVRDLIDRYGSNTAQHIINAKSDLQKLFEIQEESKLEVLSALRNGDLMIELAATFITTGKLKI